ncbi:MAG: hypothetical protein HQ538_01300 [Parcubacteria group bacterium]|nr:hypothetical protein [Parcubacteria group bacterium]
MQKKWLIPGIIALVILIIVSIIILLKPSLQSEDIKVEYSDDPRTWVDDKPRGIKEVSVDKVTKGEAYIDSNGQQYDTEKIGTVFSYEGWYEGNWFKREYIEKNKVVMRINPEMKSNDRIIEGFIVEKIENNIPYTYIFLDEDWKNLVNNTRIYWGRSYQLEQDFDFTNEISDGIYMDKIQDQIERFDNNFNLNYGGIWVGDLKEETGSTIISFG